MEIEDQNESDADILSMLEGEEKPHFQIGEEILDEEEGNSNTSMPNTIPASIVGVGEEETEKLSLLAENGEDGMEADVPALLVEEPTTTAEPEPEDTISLSQQSEGLYL